MAPVNKQRSTPTTSRSRKEFRQIPRERSRCVGISPWNKPRHLCSTRAPCEHEKRMLSLMVPSQLGGFPKLGLPFWGSL